MKTTLEKTFEINGNDLLRTEVHPDYLDETYFQPWVDSLEKEWVIRGYTVTTGDYDIDHHLYRFRVAVNVEDRYTVGECYNCGNQIKVSIFRGGKWCSDDCRKAMGKDIV